MSKSKDGGPAGGFHQEYIASLRYRNDLPPPEMPPKFLDIPHEGLERFLTPGFASNMVRREEPNIDVDAEGGMPIDLIGMPGLHLGDESAIMAPENPEPLDPADLPLLMTLDQLRNPAPKNSNVSFLRRTQYIASGGNTRGMESKGLFNSSGSRPSKTPKPKPSRDDPTYVKKYIQKGFDIAYPNSKYTGEDTASQIKGLPATKTEQDAWANPVHPDNPKLKPVGFYPVVPDLEGFPDPGGFLQFKFDKAPVPTVNGRRDDRMDTGILVPSDPEQRICQEHETKITLHKTNPALYPDPGPVPWDYDLFLPQKQNSTEQIQRSFNPVNPDKDDPANYTHEGSDESKYHQYDRLRTYATKFQVLNAEQKYKDVAIVLFDPAEANQEPHRLQQKGAYYYPILGKTRLKPERAQKIAQAGLAPTLAKSKEDQIDQLQVKVRDPNEEESQKRASHRAQVDSKFENPIPSGLEDTEASKDELMADGNATKNTVDGNAEATENT